MPTFFTNKVSWGRGCTTKLFDPVHWPYFRCIDMPMVYFYIQLMLRPWNGKTVHFLLKIVLFLHFSFLEKYMIFQSISSLEFGKTWPV